MVGLLVYHDCEPCKTGRTDWDAVCNVDSCGPKEAYIRWGAHWRHLANLIEPSVCSDGAPYVKLLWPLVIIVRPHRSTTYIDAA